MVQSLQNGGFSLKQFEMFSLKAQTKSQHFDGDRLIGNFINSEEGLLTTPQGILP